MTPITAVANSYNIRTYVDGAEAFWSYETIMVAMDYVLGEDLAVVARRCAVIAADNTAWLTLPGELRVVVLTGDGYELASATIDTEAMVAAGAVADGSTASR